MPSFDQSAVPAFADMLRLDNRTLVVVGGGNGMGRQICHALTQIGANVVCADIDGDRAAQVAGEVKGTAVTADARERADTERIVATAVSEYGRLDGVVDVVGMARWAKLLETPEDDWDWTFGMVLKHAYQMIHSAAPVMARTGGGSMAFVASIDGTISAPMHAPYGAAKAGLLNLVRTAAVELGPMGIRVNAVCPGPTATPRILEMTGGVMPASPAEGGSLYIPMGSVNATFDIAAALLYLSTPMSRLVSGQAITVDGGATQLVYDITKMPGT
ncbi:MAG: short-chain dehydrogenase/reductase [Acidimicrobiia bacterium]|nr:short-chain dehydrogenase/reductase [Acidimicrobiia bacterium]